jgi:cytoskeleton protein RodZ
MSEIESPRSEEGTVAGAESPVAGAEPLTFGRRLAAERERQGLSVDEIASRLRLHPRQVQAIENEALPALPSPVLRGFVRNYAKELRLDPESLMAELSARLGPRPDAAVRAEAGGGGAPRLNASALVSRPVVVGSALAALIALAVLGWLTTRVDRRGDTAATSPAKPAIQSPASSAPVPAADPGKEGGRQVTSTPGTTAQPAAGAPPETAGTPTTSSTAPQASAPGAVATSPQSAAPGSGTAPSTASFETVRLTFREQSWVEVTQGDGRILLSQINAAGSEQRVEGKAPLRLVIGNASGVSIDYRGKAVDLKPVTSPDNVARITLN